MEQIGLHDDARLVFLTHRASETDMAATVSDLAALADTAGGMAVYLRLPPGSRVATVEMNINYLEAVARGEVVAEAELVRLGRNLAVVDCDLFDHTRRIVAKALMTFAIISRGRKQKGRPD
jgi:uncharacterized protein (TIGR00369 family)